MKDFLKLLKTKVEEQDSFGKDSEERFLKNFNKEFGVQKPSLWETFQVRHAVAACLLIVATVTFYKTRDSLEPTGSMAALQIMENENILANMDILEELEEFEELTDEDWEVLLGEAH